MMIKKKKEKVHAAREKSAHYIPPGDAVAGTNSETVRKEEGRGTQKDSDLYTRSRRHTSLSAQLAASSSSSRISLNSKSSFQVLRASMPSWRNSEGSRKAKSAARAARCRERLGIPEWNAPQADPHQHEEALHHEVVQLEQIEPEIPFSPEIQEVEALIAQIDELLADVSTPEQPAPKAEGGEEKDAVNPSGDTATEAVTNTMEETESLNFLQQDDDDYVLQLAVEE